MKALITGITGQDGSYLAELLLSKGYKVYGFSRRTSTTSLGRIEHLVDRITLVSADLLDQNSVTSAVYDIQPDEVYNLAAQSFVPTSWSQPIFTGDVDALGVTRMLAAIRLTKPDAKLYQASSSEMFGNSKEVPQRETTPFYPRSPYGVAKTYGHWITVNYRESFGTFACSGILFNHESPRRGLEFVPRKISNAVARIRLGQADTLRLGNLEARRDWGFAGDYVKAMWLMLQQSQPDDYVVGTGESHTIRELVETAFRVAGIDDWERSVVIDSDLFRPAEVTPLVADASKARSVLGWRPTVDFRGLVTMMVEADLDLASEPEKQAAKRRAGSSAIVAAIE